ncbi:FTR1 family protein [Acidisoma cellulosilytica]|uniref:FTR1 family protein n=1 Tax=Acidisoma cellulosilyticum TaxID=2802395 RepID=A0A963Z2B2_9PROT|nr:iron uptake transporter permease EfeU [Acidisoma cellulosilyticum]MCB8881557.1 FTR1 family protein [Acidisoma cellulosilyticum]
MLATFVIGLREGLEAALIVGIIAAFLRNNGRSLTAMWAGVALAIFLSILVGVGLDLVEQALPQAAQEGMESVIGAIAIFFVTGMIAWMNKHARSMKRELEAQAAEALSQTSAFALAGMAFLAVLKEGFETAVFLLATFSAAQSAVLAATGAVLGVALAVIIGWGIYVGGVKINLSRFFRITGGFLILVAAGLVITALRTSHEAGWLNAGQQMTVNLAWLVAPGTVQSALITGVLGIPTDPRLVEVLGWFAYLIPVALYVYWPQSRRPSARGAVQLRYTIAVALLVLATGLALLYPPARPGPLPAAALVASDNTQTSLGTAKLSAHGQALVLTIKGQDSRVALPAAQAKAASHEGMPAQRWHLTSSGKPANAPATLTIDQVFDLNGGRAPIGLNFRIHPGPYDAQWTNTRTTDVWTTAGGMLLDAAQSDTTVVQLSGSGLSDPRTLTVADNANGNWQITGDYAADVSVTLGRLEAAQRERAFWALVLPALLALVALFLALAASAKTRALNRSAAAKARQPSNNHRLSKGNTHAAE